MRNLNNCRVSPGRGKTVGQLFLLLLLSSCMMAQTVTIRAKNAPIELVCKEIGKQTGYHFIYASNLTREKQSISIELENEEVVTAIEKVFKNTPYKYTVVNKVVSVNTGSRTNERLEVILPKPDTITITGFVYDTDRKPLVNVSLLTSISKKSALTDPMGKFELKGLIDGDVVTATHVGFETKQITVRNSDKSRNFFIYMPLANNELDQVVIKAYGTTSKRLNTGNIAKVSGDELRDIPTMNPLEALVGRVAGVEVKANLADPFSPVFIEIRGRNSINPNYSTEPLIIVDGLPISFLDASPYQASAFNTPLSRGFDQSSEGQVISSFYGINPKDIESIEILKDGDATAIYGSRGANGVVIITTKKGTASKPRLELGVSTGLVRAESLPNLLNTQDYLQMRREAFRNQGVVPSADRTSSYYAPDLLVWDTTRYTDWAKFFYGGTAHLTTYNASISGGVRNMTYRVGATSNKRTDMLNFAGGSSTNSLNFSMNSSSDNQKLKVGLQGALATIKNNSINFPNGASWAPNAPFLFKEDGTLNREEYYSTGVAVPFNSLETKRNSEIFDFKGGLSVSYSVAKGLTISNALRTNFSFANSYNSTPMLPPTVLGGKPTGNNAFWGKTQNKNFAVEPQINYSFVAGMSDFRLMLGGTYSSTTTEASSITGKDFTSDDLMGSITNAALITAADNSLEYKYAGLFFSLGYDFKRKYLLNFTARRDGSSRFGENKQWGNFGAVGAAWIASDEEWLNNLLPKAVTFVKFRGSYGLVGSDKIGDYQYLPQWSSALAATGTKTLPAYDGVSPLIYQLQANNEFHWSSTRKLEFAFESAFFQDKLNLIVAWYRNIAKDQLLSYHTGNYTGFSSYVTNLPATVMNRGMEFSVSGSVIRKKDLGWNISANTGFNTNRLIAYPDIEYSNYKTKYKVGGSLNSNYRFHYLGMDPQTGRPIFEDANKDGVITRNVSVFPGTEDDDRIIERKSTPYFSAGLNSSFRYKSFSLSAAFSFKRFDGLSEVGYVAMGGMKNPTYSLFNSRWKYAGDSTSGPKPMLASNPDIVSFLDSDGSIVPIDLFRLNSLSLAYSLPASWISKLKMSSCQFVVASNNVLKFTNYKGLDPESFNSYAPPLRTITLSFNCSF